MIEWIIAGVLYGFFIGLVPVAGATLGLIALYGFASSFTDPYTLVAFTTAIVVSSSIGDSFCSIVLNIPGAGGAAATMVDGFPMSQRGEAARALSAAISTSWINGLIWGLSVFLLLPYYAEIIMYFGTKEMFSFLIFAMVTIVFISSKYWIRGIIALCAGVAVGHVGLDPSSGAERWTMGIEYLGDGVQFIPIMAGVIAFPELLAAYFNKPQKVTLDDGTIMAQLKQGWHDSWRYKWDGLRGGLIGAFVGLVPGIGGNIADWFAYAQTKKERVGDVRGVVGCEGANNAQKATSYVPTILFGIPGAPFEVIIMGLFMYVGLEMGTPDVLADQKFFSTLTESYILSIILILPLAYLFIKYAVKITTIPFVYYFWPILACLIWSSVQYTGFIEDYIMFFVCCMVGIVMRYLKFSRISFIIGFVLSERIEKSYLQFTSLYEWEDLLYSNIALLFIALAFMSLIWGLFFNKSKIDFV